MEATLNRFTVDVPQDDLKFFKSFIKKMGWSIHKQKKGLAEQSLEEIEAGKDGSVTIALPSGYTPTFDCGGVSPSKEERLTDTTIKYTFLSMSKDITCKLTDVTAPQSGN